MPNKFFEIINGKITLLRDEKYIIKKEKLLILIV